MQSNFKDFYELLNIQNTATESQIKSAYRKKALHCHPDKNPDNPNAAALFRELFVAVETLTDPIRRKRYDAELREHQILWEQLRQFQNEKMAKRRKMLRKVFFTCISGILILVIYKFKNFKHVSEKVEVTLQNSKFHQASRIDPTACLDRRKILYVYSLLCPIEYPKGIVPAFSRYRFLKFTKKVFLSILYKISNIFIPFFFKINYRTYVKHVNILNL
ncbi:uncharacterized J domain-containing protein C2E1P5.03-like [Chrysoperla carnea]|uniref:uncharacterized J domain-containing protein C2E1P5.03-like n=1 Tax=Chrysoperla carnea TaxID=189513 RepID=UPI001D07BB83|nr:uncharacterized J domain-containing protein C2E1P5.03-like [Chrysoperla carnea]